MIKKVFIEVEVNSGEWIFAEPRSDDEVNIYHSSPTVDSQPKIVVLFLTNGENLVREIESSALR